jgi:hypothetical protein
MIRESQNPVMAFKNPNVGGSQTSIIFSLLTTVVHGQKYPSKDEAYLAVTKLSGAH